MKSKAIQLRKTGASLKTIERELGVARSTLSGWLKNIQLSDSHKARLLQNRNNALVVGRQKALLWHNVKKAERIDQSRKEALTTLSGIDFTDLTVVELALAILYLGEGSKKTLGTSLGSSDPLILKFFIAALQVAYQFDKSTMRAELHLRADQSIAEAKRYWSRELGLPLKNFTYAHIDKRTKGSKTYSTYNGVCHIRCGNTHIQRRLIFLSRLFCENIVKEYLGS